MTIAGAGVPNLPAWWADLGRAGYTPGADLGTAFPWTLAGLARGAWQADEPGRAPSALPFPGVLAAATPLAFFDSVWVAPGVERAGPGFGAPLASAVGQPGSAPDRRARALFAHRGGSFGLDENGLILERGDSLAWLRAETSAANHGAVGGRGEAAQHRWGGSGALTRGAHRVEVAYAQRGSGARLRDESQQSAAGESGGAAYRYRRAGWEGGVALARGYDFHQSFGPLLPYSRRDAQEVRALGDLRYGGTAGALALAIEGRRTTIVRAFAQAAAAQATMVQARLGLERPAGEGRLRVELAAGRDGGADRFELAPAATYRFRSGGYDGRILLARLLEPVWADLAAGQAPFLQSVWAGGFEIGGEVSFPHRARAARARAGFLAGRARDRALVGRAAIEDLWLRAGYVAEPDPYDFGLLTLSAAGQLRHVGADLEGFALARDPGAVQPQVDPGYGAHAGLETRFAAFQNDLGVTLRAEAAGVGPRESQNVPSRRLSGYVTFGASAVLTLADAMITLQLRNLEDRPREEVWVDPATGREALGPGREIRLALSWRFSN
ncbi:MAG: hypothetical protein A2W00_00765 [Candidatus Eisenbacteria bacterium RBG_16_71_46]|nr:MAG: hypothetical protein A2W00_00765 [Candidatus Eisenbacteria bacterium RBG_16_71_46]